MSAGGSEEEAELIWEDEGVDLSGNVFDVGVEVEVSTGGGGIESNEDMSEIVVE